MQQIVSLWVGPALGDIERMCLASFIAHGHPVALYGYDLIKNMPTGVELRDASKVMSREALEQHRGAGGSLALFSDRFRYELQRLSLGLWVDTDVVCHRPITLEGPFIAGRESDEFLNGAVLKLAHDSPLLNALIRAYDRNRLPSWVSFTRAPHLKALDLLGVSIPPQRHPRGTHGPRAITAVAAAFGLTGAAQRQTVFYPIHPRYAEQAFVPGRHLEEFVTDDTLTIHLWNEKLGVLRKSAPPPGSIMAALLDRYSG